ncbi:hypothetical protein ES703_80605 [subsurface metagenome]
MSEKRCARRLVTMDGCQDEGYVSTIAEGEAFNQPILDGFAENTVLRRKRICQGVRRGDYLRVAYGFVAAGKDQDDKESTSRRAKGPFPAHIRYSFPWNIVSQLSADASGLSAFLAALQEKSQKTDDRGQRTEDRRQKTDDRRRKSDEGRGIRTGDNGRQK